MVPHTLHLSLLMGIIYSSVLDINADLCRVNECVCVNDLAVCDRANVWNPQFTRNERLIIRELRVDVKQSKYIGSRCRLFTSLRQVTISHKHVESDDFTECPRFECPRVRVTCL